MKWIILIGDDKFNLDTIRSIKHCGSVAEYDVKQIINRYCIDYEDDHVFYDYLGDTLTDYDSSDMQRVPFMNPHFIMMVYTSEKK